MGYLSIVAFYLGVVTYSVASTLYLLELGRPEKNADSPWSSRSMALAATFHGGHIVATSLLTNTCPVESIQFVLSSAAWTAAVLYLLVRTRARLHAIGALVAPLGLAFMVSAQFVGSSPRPSDLPRSLLAVHVTSNLLGLGLFLLAGATGAFYLVQERRLKSKRIAALGKMPPLDSLDRAEHRLLSAGFLALTVGIATGAAFASSVVAGPQTARAVLSVVTWLIVGSVLLLRAIAGWRGRRAAYGTLAGVLGIVLVIVLYVVRAGGGEA